MEEKMQGIRASDLVVGYEGKSVLKDVNFWVRPGQILTLIGPNGSGKSTLLKSITRQLKTIAGQVYLAEGTMDAYTDAALAKQMAMVTTERISPELMTCRDVVATGRYPYTGRFGVLGKEDEEKVQEAWKVCMHLRWQTGFLPRSATDKDSASCLPGRSVRNQRY